MTSVDTRGRILRSAEHLFATRGIDGPSLREITREAGQRNTGALQYHFGSRDDLLAAICEKHTRRIDDRRRVLIDRLEISGADDRAIVQALVLPAVSALDDPDGGPEYLQVAGQIVNQPRRFSDLLIAIADSAQMRRWTRLVEPLLPPEGVGRPLHRRTAAFRFVHCELASRARETSSSDHRLFANHLIDLALAMLVAPVSDETAALISPDGT